MLSKRALKTSVLVLLVQWRVQRGAICYFLSLLLHYSPLKSYSLLLQSNLSVNFKIAVQIKLQHSFAWLAGVS